MDIVNPKDELQKTDDVRLVAIVDDDESMLRSTCRLIRSFGYRAEAFSSGEDFLRSSIATEAGCLLLDVRMPGMDGLEVQRQLTDRAIRMPIVFFTGLSNDQEEHRALAAGAVEFLRKPVGEARLREALDRALRASGRTSQGE